MKKKKRERQERERKERVEQQKQEFYDSLPVVVLNSQDDNPIQYERAYRWNCHYCKNTYTYSQKVNDIWGHPHKYAFCAVCCKYHKIDTEKSGLVLVG